MLQHLPVLTLSLAHTDYLHSWHYQSDGWLSAESAAVYEASTETLFLGRQDAMQRAGLSLLCRHLAAASLPVPAPRILDVGAGTGRFLTFVRDALPHADVTVAELSPFYLAEARAAHAHWEELRGAKAAQQRGGGAVGTAAFVQAAAESLPFEDSSFDVVTAVYLFHELPPAARAAAAAEMARVLRPGGLLVLTDSVQLGDRPRLDGALGRFGDFNEVRPRAPPCAAECACADARAWLRRVRSPTTARTSRRTWGSCCAAWGWCRSARRCPAPPRRSASSSLQQRSGSSCRRWSSSSSSGELGRKPTYRTPAACK